jgi:hypothetical protein
VAVDVASTSRADDYYNWHRDKQVTVTHDTPTMIETNTTTATKYSTPPE